MILRAQEHYPENLWRAYIINAPSIFHGAWRLIASVIDKRTQAKFCIRKDRCTQALASVLGSPLAVEKVRQAVVSPRVTELNATGAWCNAYRYTVPAADLCARRLLWTFEVEDGLPLDFEISCYGIETGEPSGTVLPRHTVHAGCARGAIPLRGAGIYVFRWDCSLSHRGRSRRVRQRIWLDSETWGLHTDPEPQHLSTEPHKRAEGAARRRQLPRRGGATPSGLSCPSVLPMGHSTDSGGPSDGQLDSGCEPGSPSSNANTERTAALRTIKPAATKPVGGLLSVVWGVALCAGVLMIAGARRRPV